MSEILIASHLNKTWTAERSLGPGRAARPSVISGLQDSSHTLPAIYDVSFSVEAGEIFGLVGPSGSGKSTLLGLLSGQIKPDSGRVEVFGQELSRPAPDPRKVSTRMCLISQMTSSQVFNRLGAVENLLYSARLQGTRNLAAEGNTLEKQARTLLSEFGISQAEMDLPLCEARFTTLQKVVLGRALFSLPRILMLDEITNGMDLETRSVVLEVLRRYSQAHGITIILATRSLRTAAQLCDRITFVSQGKLTHMIQTAVQPQTAEHALNQASLSEYYSYEDLPAYEPIMQ